MLLKKAMEPHLSDTTSSTAEDGLLGAAGALVPRPAPKQRVRDAVLGPRLASPPAGSIAVPTSSSW